METITDSSSPLMSTTSSMPFTSFASLPVPRIIAKIVYAGKDVSRELAPYLSDLTYIDKIGGEADTLNITLDNSDHRWENAWYPGFGDKLEVQIGYDGQALLPCGVFEIDTVTFDGPPDTVTIQTRSAGVTIPLRTLHGSAYENMTLADIVAALAKRNHLTLKGNIDPIKIVRATQASETDLAFLKRLAQAYGYDFSIRGTTLTFYKREDLKALPPVMTILRTDVKTYHFSDTVHDIPKAATIKSHNVKKKNTITQSVPDSAVGKSPHVQVSADTLNINPRAEDEGQAKVKANAAIKNKNDKQTTLMLELYGNPKLMAGINVMVAGFGRLDGKYTVTNSIHQLTNVGGYTSTVNLQRVREATHAV